MLAWCKTGGKDLGTGQTPEQLRCNRHCWLCTASTHKTNHFMYGHIDRKKTQTNTSKAPSYGNPESKVHTPQRNKVFSVCTVKQTLCKQTEMMWWDFAAGTESIPASTSSAQIIYKIDKVWLPLVYVCVYNLSISAFIIEWPVLYVRIRSDKRYLWYWPTVCCIKKEILCT